MMHITLGKYVPRLKPLQRLFGRKRSRLPLHEGVAGGSRPYGSLEEKDQEEDISSNVTDNYRSRSHLALCGEGKRGQGQSKKAANEQHASSDGGDKPRRRMMRSPSQAVQGRFVVGARAFGQFGSTAQELLWYPCTISAVHRNGSFNVVYDDGNIEFYKPLDRLELQTSLIPEEKTVAAKTGLHSYSLVNLLVIGLYAHPTTSVILMCLLFYQLLAIHGKPTADNAATAKALVKWQQEMEGLEFTICALYGVLLLVSIYVLFRICRICNTLQVLDLSPWTSGNRYVSMFIQTGSDFGNRDDQTDRADMVMQGMSDSRSASYDDFGNISGSRSESGADTASAIGGRGRGDDRDRLGSAGNGDAAAGRLNRTQHRNRGGNEEAYEQDSSAVEIEKRSLALSMAVCCIENITHARAKFCLDIDPATFEPTQMELIDI
jgi:hypothetical protein